ncbi:hypothetical protein [Thermoplasma sp.]|uniref:hypothetical protein n=1 Tax=Thermoplasma sp. TaxID=1973142 RepID=UPI00127AF6DC|nr:hypothetical protein [Thermoplasma sp.]KAA8922008.1 MAG: hypothetical protein F6Q11_06535 [Thermoplasma sp.]
MKGVYGVLIVLAISLALTIFFLFSGFWYGVMIAGILATAFVSIKPMYSITASTLISMTAFIIFEIPLMMDGLMRLMFYVGSIAGINGNILVIIAILLDGMMALGGSFIGVFINRVAFAGKPAITGSIGKN